MFEFAIPAARISESPVSKHQRETGADVLDRPEWVGSVPLVELLARWSTARRKHALGAMANRASQSSTSPNHSTVNPTCA
ncbi:MAG: hypothetical protein ACE37E_01520 [Hyphomicrobiales bacterium]